VRAQVQQLIGRVQELGCYVFQGKGLRSLPKVVVGLFVAKVKEGVPDLLCAGARVDQIPDGTADWVKAVVVAGVKVDHDRLAVNGFVGDPGAIDSKAIQ
jgi:hypothetical protein